MQRANVVVIAFLFFALIAANLSGMAQQRTIPLPDDDPANKVAAPETAQPAPATAVDSGAAAPSDGGWTQSATISGIKADFRGVPSLKDVVIKTGPMPVSLNAITSSEMVEGQQAVLQFRFTDAAGSPLRGLRVASWMDQAQDGKLADDALCHKKIQSFLQMNLSAQPEVDFNNYYLLALTEEPGILVIDPRIGFASSKLYSVIDLPAPGADWVQSKSGERVFVSMPKAGQVAAIDSMSFRVMMNITVGGKPGRVLLQPDGRRLWVAIDSVSGSGQPGVAVIDTGNFEVVAKIATGKGRHEIAFDEADHAYISNQDDGTVSIVNTATLKKLKDVSAGKQPVAMLYSSRAKAAFVASQIDGKITIISADTQTVRSTLTDKPGFTALLITPDGRWGFVANGKQGTVLLFDVSAGRFVQEYAVGPSPDQLALSDAYVYVRSRENEHVRLISLSEIGRNANTAEFPAGQAVPGGLGDFAASLFAPGLDGTSTFVSNPADRRIYFYQEGMAAPMSSIEGYGKTPKGLMILDRSIHETSAGVYSVGLRLPKPGVYDVPVYVDSPALSHCYQFTVKENPLLKKQKPLPVSLHALKTNLQIKTGETARVQFRLLDGETEKPRDGLKDVAVTVLLAEGLRQMQLMAEPRGEGVYEFSFIPPKDGVYYAMVKISSLGIRQNQLPYLMVHALAQATSQANLPEMNAVADQKQ